VARPTPAADAAATAVAPDASCSIAVRWAAERPGPATVPPPRPTTADFRFFITET
jgi:hypothetical protein